MDIETDKYWMRVALQQAEQAARIGEVPVGAVLVLDGRMLAAAGNQPIGLHDPCAHAEIRVLREAAALQENYRLPGSTLYVTLEPCTMCVGAIVHARVSRLVFGAFEPKAGAIVSQNNLLDQAYMNSHVLYQGGVMAEEAGRLLTAFFESRRAQKKQEKAARLEGKG